MPSVNALTEKFDAMQSPAKKKSKPDDDDDDASSQSDADEPTSPPDPIFDYPPFDRLPSLKNAIGDGAAAYFERDFLVTTVLDFLIGRAPKDAGEYGVCVFLYAQGLGKRAAARVLSNVTIIERGLLADRADAKKYAYGNPHRRFGMPSYEKPKQPEIKFELGLTHVQAWSQFERTGTIDKSQLALPEISGHGWSPNMSYFCDENYWFGLPDDVRAMLDAQIEALPDDENKSRASNAIIEQYYSSTRRDAARSVVLGQIEKSLFLHDALDVSRGSGWDPYETTVAVSASGAAGRVIFLVTTANHRSYMCESTKNFGVRAVWSQEVVDEQTGERGARTRCVDLLFYAFGQGEGSEDYEGDVSVADRASCDAVAAALGIPADKIGTALRAFVLAANVRGHGCLDWEALEVLHAGRSLVSGFFDDRYALHREEDGDFGTWYGNEEDHWLVRLRGFGAVDAFPNIQGAQTHDGFERGAAFEPAEGDYRERKNSPYRALKYVQDFAMALKPADLASLPALVNALRVTCKYKKPVYWRERLSNDKYFPRVEKNNFRSEHPDTLTVTFQLTTTGVLAREQARRKSRRFNEYDNYGPDGPEFPGF